MSRTAVKAPTPAPTLSQKSTVSQVLVFFSGKGTPLMQCFGSFHTYKVSFQTENTKKWAVCRKRENLFNLHKTSCSEVEGSDNFLLKANKITSFRFSDFRFSVILSNQSPPCLCLQVQAWQKDFLLCMALHMIQYGLNSYWEYLCLPRSCWSTGQLEPVQGLPNIWLEKAAAKTLQASRMNLWTDTWKPFLACPWWLWLWKNWSPLDTPSFSNNCPVSMNVLRVHIPTHRVGQHKPALLQEPHCHWHKHSWVSTQLLPQLASKPAQKTLRSSNSLTHQLAQQISTRVQVTPKWAHLTLTGGSCTWNPFLQAPSISW